MKRLNLEELVILDGGRRNNVDCGMAIAGVALSIAGFFFVPAGGIGAAAVAAGSHLVSVYGLKSCA